MAKRRRKIALYEAEIKDTLPKLSSMLYVRSDEIPKMTDELEKILKDKSVFSE